MSRFSDNLKQLRKQNRMTQTQLAEKIGVGRSTVSMYEMGEREPDFETLEAIADIFNIDMALLIGAETKNPPTTPGEGMDDFTYAAHGYSGRLTDADKATLIKMMETLAAANEEDNGQADGGLQRPE